MEQLKFNIAGQTLTRTDSLRVVADSIGQYESLFTFDDSWDGYIATAQYTKNGVTYDENIVDGVSEVPAEALIGSGQIHVHVVGNSPDGERITVNDLLVPIDPSGWRQKSSISAGPVITVWHKVVAMLLLLRGGTAGQFLRKKSADNYDGEWVTLPIDVDAAYRTAAEVDAALDGKAATAHIHDNRYAPIIKSRNDLPAPSAGVAGFTFMWGGQQEGGSGNRILFTPGHFYRCSGGLNDDRFEYEYAYTADATVTAETTGTYYINLGAMGYTPVTLPADYTVGTVYYTRTRVTVYEWEEVSVTDLRSLEDTANKVTSIDGDSTDEQYPSAKCVYDTIDGVASYKQDKPLFFKNLLIEEAEWQGIWNDPTYIYAYLLSDSRITADMAATPYYSIADEATGNFARYVEVVDGQLILYAKESLDITIPLIKCERTS